MTHRSIAIAAVAIAVVATAGVTSASAAPADTLALRVDVSTEACATSTFFKSVGGLALETEVVEYQEGGVNGGHVGPGRVRWGQVALTGRAALANDACVQQWLATPDTPAEVVITLERPTGDQDPPAPLARWTMAALPSGFSSAGRCVVLENDLRPRRTPCVSSLRLEVLDLQVSGPSGQIEAPVPSPSGQPALEVQLERADGTVEVDHGWRVSNGGEAFGRGPANGRLVLRRDLRDAQGTGVANWVDDTTHAAPDDLGWARIVRLSDHSANGRRVECTQGFPVSYRLVRLDATTQAPMVEEVEFAGLHCQ